MLPILDLFLLALIAEGADTPYRWQRQASVSTGASLPSVRRLLARGLVREAVPGPRGSRRFSLTRAGRAELDRFDEYAEAALEGRAPDPESLWRLVSVAVTRDRAELAAKLLKRAIGDRDGANLNRTKAVRFLTVPGSVAEFYSAITAEYDLEREDATIRCAKSLARLVERKARGKRAIKTSV